MTCNTFNKILNVHSQQQCVSSFPGPSWLYLIVPWLCLWYYRPISFSQSWPVAFRWDNRVCSLENGQLQKQCLHSWSCPSWRGFGPFPPSYQSVKNKKTAKEYCSIINKKRTCHNDPHLPITWGETMDDSGDSGMFWEHENEPPLGSTTDPVRGVVGGLWHRIWVTLWIPAVTSSAFP